jgi:hypothetical protein
MITSNMSEILQPRASTWGRCYVALVINAFGHLEEAVSELRRSLQSDPVPYWSLCTCAGCSQQSEPALTC